MFGMPFRKLGEIRKISFLFL